MYLLLGHTCLKITTTTKVITPRMKTNPNAGSIHFTLINTIRPDSASTQSSATTFMPPSFRTRIFE